MTKLEWCRRNAPGALHDLPDDELLDYMSDAYRLHLLFLAKRLLVDLIYSQAHVENICVTFAETNEIINNISSSAKPDAINKVCCLRDCWEYVFSTIDVTCTLVYLEDLHNILARFDVPFMELGVVRYSPVRISGTTWRPGKPDVLKVEKALSKANDLDSIILAGLTIMREQLFLDGNKRVGSFAINKLLIQHDLGVFLVREEDDSKYKELLVNYYETDDPTTIISWIKERCIIND